MCPAHDCARFEERDGFDLISYPTVPITQLNGVWVRDDREDVAAALGPALAELEPTGAPLWIQTRDGHAIAQTAARQLGYTVEVRIPGMVLAPGDLVEPAPSAAVEQAESDADFDGVLDALAAGFEAPRELLAPFVSPPARSVPGIRTYLVRADGQVASTALGFVHEGTVGIFNVATPPQFRRRGYGGAVTAAAVRDGLAAGAEFAWLQSSDEGEPVYRRLGFREVVAYTAFTRP
jgi:ribosomal protein S18 acetylase RimI-like enzyme